MSINTLLLIGVPADLIPVRAIAAPITGSIFALPARCAALAWQVILDTASNAINVTIEVSLDGVNWTVLDTSTVAAGEVRTITTPTAAQFVHAKVNSVTAGGASTMQVTTVAKVALP